MSPFEIIIVSVIAVFCCAWLGKRVKSRLGDWAHRKSIELNKCHWCSGRAALQWKLGGQRFNACEKHADEKFCNKAMQSLELQRGRMIRLP